MQSVFPFNIEFVLKALSMERVSSHILVIMWEVTFNISWFHVLQHFESKLDNVKGGVV